MARHEGVRRVAATELSGRARGQCMAAEGRVLQVEAERR
jgi:hypothetical protein